jgi:hypothetical protein
VSGGSWARGRESVGGEGEGRSLDADEDAAAARSSTAARLDGRQLMLAISELTEEAEG